jgi:hypothetical protein
MRRVITSELAFARSTRPDQLGGILERAGFVTSMPLNSSSNGLVLAAEG